MHRAYPAQAATAMAVIVAATLEQAEHAATLVTVDYTEQAAKLSLTTEKSHAVVPTHVLGASADLNLGDAAGALAVAPYTVDNVYSTPPYNHNAIELHATLAHWSEDATSLTVYDATQYVIGYIPQGESTPGEHRLRVEVNHAGAKIRHRRGYRVAPPEKEEKKK